MFTILLQLLFSWLPPSLWVGVWAVMAVTFLIIMIKIVTTLLELLGKVIGLFL